MADKKPDKRTVAARIDNTVIERLEALARADRRTLSFLIADAVIEYVERREQPRRPRKPR